MANRYVTPQRRSNIDNASPPQPSAAPGFQAKFISVMTGLLGVATGIAVFILLVGKPEEITLWFGFFLLVASTLSFIFEYIRNQIEGHAERLSFSRVLTVLVVLAIFELFVAAIHASFNLEWTALEDIASAVAGPGLGSRLNPQLNLILMAFLWVAIGGMLALALTYSIYWPFSSGGWLTKEKRRGWVMGLMAGVIGAPAVVFAYILSVRVLLELIFIVANPRQWANYLDKLCCRVPIPWLIYPMSWTSQNWGRWGVVFALVLAVAILFLLRKTEAFKVVVVGLIIVFGAPLAGLGVIADLKTIGKILAFVAICWSAAGVILGVITPVLNQWSSNPRHWAYLSWAASLVMVAFALAVRSEWFWACVIFAILFFIAGMLLRLGGSPAEYWAIATISIAVVILGGTHLMFKANFFNVNDLCLSLINEHLAALEIWGQQPAQLRYSDISEDVKSQIKLQDPKLFKEIQTGIDLEKSLKHVPQKEARKAVGSGKDGKSLVLPVPTLIERGEDLIQQAGSLSANLRIRSDRLNEIIHEKNAIEKMAKAARLESTVQSFIATESGGRLKESESEKTTAELLDLSQSMLEQLKEIQAAVKTASDSAAQTPHPNPSVEKALQYVQQMLGETPEHLPALKSLSDRLADQIQAIVQDRAELERISRDLKKDIVSQKKAMTQEFELCVAGSLGFWLAMGILATWSNRNRQRQDNTDQLN